MAVVDVYMEQLILHLQQIYTLILIMKIKTIQLQTARGGELYSILIIRPRDSKAGG